MVKATLGHTKKLSIYGRIGSSMSEEYLITTASPQVHVRYLYSAGLYGNTGQIIDDCGSC